MKIKIFIGILSRVVFERHASIRSGLFAFLGGGVPKIVGQRISIRAKKLALSLTLKQRFGGTRKWSTVLPLESHCKYNEITIL